jgi:UDP-N-acetylmuramate--alanine ligase
MSEQTGKRSSQLAGAGTVHFIGIGGAGMSGLAEVLMARGKTVTGSDASPSATLDRLRRRGARVFVGHSAESVHGADLIVVTSAARPDNPEVREAQRLDLPMVKRAELLGWLMNPVFGLAVSGTHGKTTTTGMLAFVLREAGKDPTALIGGEPLDFESNAVLGNGPYLVTEADEFDRSFLQLWPKVAIITSVEADHLDCYADLDDITRTFALFASRVPPEGLLITCADDPVLSRLELSVPRQSYGFAEGAGWHILRAEPAAPFGTNVEFVSPVGNRLSCELQLPGAHYAQNAVAAIAAASHVGVDPELAAMTLARFRGTRRRFEVLGEAAGVIIVDDYAHHPTEARGTLRAVRERHPGQVWCVFQPHTVNRTERLKEEFASAFEDAGHLLLLPVYHPAGRRDESEFGSKDLLEIMSHPDARYVDGFAEAVSLLRRELSAGDIVITMGAGDVYEIGGRLLAEMSRDERK